MKNGWKKVKLGDLFSLKYGKGLKEENRIPGKYPVYGSGGIVGYHNEALVKGPGIIIGRKGSIGTVQFSKKDFFPIDTVFYVDLNFDKNDLKFIYYLLQHTKLNSLNTDAAVPGLNREVALSQTTHVPILPTQRKIASILSAYDDLIENNTRRIKILEQMASAIYREWFVEFRSPNVELRMATPEEKKLTGKDVFPKGWEVKTLGELVDFQKGRKPKITYEEPGNGKIPYLLLEGIENGKYLYTDDPKVAIAVKDDVVMVMDGARSGLVYIGVCGAVGSTLATFRSKEKKIVSPYLFYQFLKDQFENIIKKNVGSAIPHASKDFIFGMPLFLPTESVNKKYNEISEPLYLEVQNFKLKNSNLRRTRDLLLPKLISGEIDVENFEFRSTNGECRMTNGE